MERYRVLGMDCAKDADEVAHAARAVAGIENPRTSVASQTLAVEFADPVNGPDRLQAALKEIGYQLEPLNAAAQEASTATDSYRRALWIVVALNVGYGIAEMVGGFIAGSQAVKADALDFLGDGLITMLGVVAIGRSLHWRARAALIQGIFLGLLGLGVIGTTLYRVLVEHRPEADVMGVLGMIALAVNVASAIVLIPHRKGDANVRAVWLFSRNDAIGNAAVVLAAILVAVLDSRWPDLVVAFVIAGLFLQSSVTIMRDARRDLKESGGNPG